FQPKYRTFRRDPTARIDRRTSESERPTRARAVAAGRHRRVLEYVNSFVRTLRFFGSDEKPRPDFTFHIREFADFRIDVERDVVCLEMLGAARELNVIATSYRP